MEMNALDWIAFVLVIIGGLNWGLVGLFQLDLVQMVLGTIGWLATVVYVLIGLAAVYLVIAAFAKK